MREFSISRSPINLDRPNPFLNPNPQAAPTRVNNTLSYARARISREHAYGRMGDLFGDEATAERTFRRMLWPNGFRCRNCQSYLLKPIGTRSIFQCRQCRAQQSLTTGTPLAGTRSSLQGWAACLFNATFPAYALPEAQICQEFQISPRQLTRRKDLLRTDTPAIHHLLAAFLKEMSWW